MSTQLPPPNTDNEQPVLSAAPPGTALDAIAVSQGYGPIPTISVSQSGTAAETTTRLPPAIARAVRAVSRWALQHLSSVKTRPAGSQDPTASRQRPKAPGREGQEKAVSEVPDELRYSEDHLWVRPDSGQGPTAAFPFFGLPHP